MAVQKVEISYKTIVFTVFFLLSLVFLYEIRQILLLLFVSFIFISSLNPIVDSIEKARIPRSIAIMLTYLAITSVVILAIIGIAPLVVAQSVSFSTRIPDLIRGFQSLGVQQDTLSSQLGQLWSVPLSLLQVTFDLFNNLVNLIVVAAITFYLLLERKHLNDHLTTAFGVEGQKQARRIVDLLEGKLGGWVRGEVILMSSVGLLSYLGFKILGMDFALPIAVLAGLLEIIPNVGPIIAAVIAIIAALSISPTIAVAVLAWAFIIQQIEAHILVPKVMQSATGVHPVVSIVGLLVGLKIAGTPGAILAIPLILVLDVLLREFLASRGVTSKSS